MTYAYTPYYCEENVFHLCSDPTLPASTRAAIVVSNALRRVAVAHQRAAPNADAPIIWDYHVLLAAWSVEGWAIWDLDTTLGLPVPLDLYLRASFAYPEGFAPPFDARFRVIPAAQYRSTLCSDRSHMREASGRYRAPPPHWPPIGTGTNLDRFIDMDDDFVGEVVGLAELPAALARLEPSEPTPR